MEVRKTENLVLGIHSELIILQQGVAKTAFKAVRMVKACQGLHTPSSYDLRAGLAGLLASAVSTQQEVLGAEDLSVHMVTSFSTTCTGI